jgi:hypothetical protein
MGCEDVGEILADFGKKNPGNCTELIQSRLKASNNNSIFQDTSLIISDLKGVKD